MPRYGLSVVKKAAFRNSTQEFTNVYHYQTQTNIQNPTDLELEGLLDYVVGIEKSIHDSGVTFVRGRVWLTGTGQETNVMRVIKTLSGVGTLAAAAAYVDRERAWLVQVDAGVSSKGKPVKLKKWFHTKASFGGTSLTTPQIANEDQLATAQRNGLQTAVTDLRHPVAMGQGYDLVAQNGRPQTGSQWVTHKYLEHHQLGDQWRGG